MIQCRVKCLAVGQNIWRNDDSFMVCVWPFVRQFQHGSWLGLEVVKFNPISSILVDVEVSGRCSDTISICIPVIVSRNDLFAHPQNCASLGLDKESEASRCFKMDLSYEANSCTRSFIFSQVAVQLFSIIEMNLIGDNGRIRVQSVNNGHRLRIFSKMVVVTTICKVVQDSQPWRKFLKTIDRRVICILLPRVA